MGDAQICAAGNYSRLKVFQTGLSMAGVDIEPARLSANYQYRQLQQRAAAALALLPCGPAGPFLGKFHTQKLGYY